jgi:hypothetical protein
MQCEMRPERAREREGDAYMACGGRMRRREAKPTRWELGRRWENTHFQRNNDFRTLETKSRCRNRPALCCVILHAHVIRRALEIDFYMCDFWVSERQIGLLKRWAGTRRVQSAQIAQEGQCFLTHCSRCNNCFHSGTAICYKIPLLQSVRICENCCY